MSDEFDDPILDAGLDEVLGGVAPPDLSQRIAHALESGQVPPHVLQLAQSLAPTVAPPPVVQQPPLDESSPRVATIPRRSSRRHDARRLHLQWLAATISMSLVVAAGTYLLTSSSFQNSARDLAGENDRTLQQKGVAKQAKNLAVPGRNSAIGPRNSPHSKNVSARQALPNGQASSDPHIDPIVERSDPLASDSRDSDPIDSGSSNVAKSPRPGPVAPEKSISPAHPAAEAVAESAARRPQRELIAAIDQQLRAGWTAGGVQPSLKATDAEWCRRVFLGIIGRVPSVAELEAFLEDRRPTKRFDLVDRLLTGEQYVAEYARNWSSIWTNLLIGRSGDTQSERIDRTGLQQYLRRVFAENKPLDRVAFELLTATGSTTPGAADFNGATNFLVAHSDSRGIQASAKAAQVFLGRQIQCMQCHNHPFYDGRAHQFWELAAFFRQTKVETLAGGQGARLVDQDFVGESGDADSAETYWENQAGVMSVAYPVFLDGTKVPASGEVQKVNRRRELARLITRSPMLSEALVNRVWEHFFGRAFTTEVDDMGPHASVSHPALLGLLSEQFTAHSYDLRSLVRWIALSEAYGLSSRFNPSNKRDDLGTEDAPLFSRYYLRQMQPEQIYESLATLGGNRDRLGDLAQLDRSRSQWVGQLAIPFKTDDCTECTLWDGSIPQTLLMMNGEMTSQATQVAQNSFLRNVEQMAGPTTKKVERLFFAAVARRPSVAEMQAAGKLIAARNGQIGPALEDLWWALLNSSEFIMDR